MSLDLGVVTGSLSPAGGGLFECMRVPTNLVAQRGAAVSVYGLHDDQFEAARGAWTVSQLQAFPIAGPRRFGWSPEMQRALDRADHQLLHLHGIWFYPSYLVKRWRERTGRPTVISPAGMLDEWSVRQSASKKRLIRRLYEDENLRRASALHANSVAELEAIRKFGLANPVAILPNGVVLPDLARTLPRPAALPSDRKALLFLGRIHAKKGLKELVEAWALVRQLKPAVHRGWQIVVAGWDDGFQTELETLIAERGLGPDIRLAGSFFGDDKLALLRHADAFILPSHGEGMPMAVLEAWAAAAPVLMTAACNLTDSFARGAAFPISIAPEAMARELIEALGADAALRATGSAGRRHAEASHSWPVIVDGLVETYDWLLGGRPRPDCIVV